MSTTTSIAYTYLKFFDETIDSVISDRDYCLVDPKRDFTRNRSVLNLEAVFKSHYLFKDESITASLPEIAALSKRMVSRSLPWDSAFCAARSKIRPEAFKLVFDGTNEKTKSDHLFNGYKIMAVDGSEQCIFGSSASLHLEAKSKNGSKRHFVHINSLYDVLENTFVDVVVQPADFRNEDEALLEMAFDNPNLPANTLFTADRGYESLILFYRLSRIGAKYLIRIKDIDSYNSILKHFNFREDQEFDSWFSFQLHPTPTKTKDDPARNKYIWNYQEIPEFETMESLDLNVRIVRFPIEKASGDTVYECLLTNLDESEFTSEELKEVYHLRWQIETSFNHLKHQVGLDHIKSRTLAGIEQEIYAKMTIYNLASRIRNHLEAKAKKKKSRHRCRINLSNVIRQVRRFMFKAESMGDLDIDSFLQREQIPVIDGRPDTRRKYRSRQKQR